MTEQKKAHRGLGVVLHGDLLRPLLIGTNLLSENHEVKFRWAELTKLLQRWPQPGNWLCARGALQVRKAKFCSNSVRFFSTSLTPVLVGAIRTCKVSQIQSFVFDVQRNSTLKFFRFPLTDDQICSSVGSVSRNLTELETSERECFTRKTVTCQFKGGWVVFEKARHTGVFNC